jgi:adenylate cyclase
MDFAAEGLLDGLQDDEREARRELLTRLADDGFSLPELKAAVAEDRLALLPVERVLGGTYTAGEMEERTGVPAAWMLRIRRLQGLPEPAADERAFDEGDIAAAQSTKLFLQAGFSEEAIVEITRVLGEGMSRLTATTTAAFVEAFLREEDSESEVALRFGTLAEQLIPAIAPVLIAAYKAHLRESVSRGMLSRAELESGQVAGAQDVVVCFADLVGFTRLGGQVELQELGTVAGRLAETAAEVTTLPARLVKTIGDAAMFVSPQAESMVEVALALVQAIKDADLPSVRAGVAIGPAVMRAGDYYGNSVNLASRVTGVARPGSVLCTEEVRDAAPDRFDWSFAGRHKLKGFSDPVPLYRARGLSERGSSPAKKSRSAANEPRSDAKTPRADRPRKRASR